MMRFTLFGVCFVLAGSVCFAQTTPTPALTASASKPSAVIKTNKLPPTTQPLWSDIKPEQQAALLPLQSEWSKISAAQKQKWLEISKNYAKLQPEDQVKLHSRMKDWVGLSPQQRAQARLNFSTAKTLTSEEKQKQWEAYQALSPDEKQKLQAHAKANQPNSAALATKPQNKLVPTSKLQPTSQPREQAKPIQTQ